MYHLHLAKTGIVAQSESDKTGIVEEHGRGPRAEVAVECGVQRGCTLLGLLARATSGVSHRTRRTLSSQSVCQLLP